MSKLFAALLATLLTLGVGYYAGYKVRDAKARSDDAARLAAEQRETLARIKNNERVAEQQQIDTDKLKAAYEKELDDSRHANAVNARGLRINAAICDGFARPAQTSSAAGSNEPAATTRVVPESYQRNFEQLADEVEQVFASCRAAQQFIIDNGFYRSTSQSALRE